MSFSFVGLKSFNFDRLDKDLISEDEKNDADEEQKRRESEKPEVQEF